MTTNAMSVSMSNTTRASSGPKLAAASIAGFSGPVDTQASVDLVIDGAPVQVPAGTTLLKAARENGRRIPTLCWLEGVNQTGSCRLCVVEVEGQGELLTACNTVAEPGMVVTINSDRIRSSRKGLLRLLMNDHHEHCFECVKAGDCELQDLGEEYGVPAGTYLDTHSASRRNRTLLAGHPFLQFDPSLCINCERCVSMCADVVGRHAIGTIKDGRTTVIDAPFGEDWKTTLCESCGNCLQACPTAAITDKRRHTYRAREVSKVSTTCPHCGTGCQIDLVVRDNKIVDAVGGDGPVNRGLLCAKGRSGSIDFVHSPDRLRTPLIKNKATGEFEEASWDEALDLIAREFTRLRDTYGPQTLAGFACSRSPNEDIYMTQKFVRTCLRTNNVDNCARVCHSASVAGLAMTLGSGAMTNPIHDITGDVDAILLIGSNPEEAHPIVGMNIRQAVQRGTRLIVVDPREIDLCKDADLHVRVRPGTNVAFANGMLNVMITEDLVDHAFIAERTEGFEEMKKLAAEYPPERVAEICQIDPDMLREAARLYATAERAPIIYCLGVTEHSSGTEGVMSLSNLALATGKLGKPGCGINPLRGQNNVQGGCDMGAQPGDFPGYQKVAADGVVDKFEEAWGVSLDREPGIMATDILAMSARGEMKGLFSYGEDPVRTDPDTAHIIKAMENLEFFAIIELFMTDTAKYADVILPGLSFAEKTGTFTNTERRVQMVRQAVVPAPGLRPETEVLADLMNRMGYPQPVLTPAEIMDEIASVTPSFGGISHARLEAGESLQWPCPTPESKGTPILHIGSFTRGLGRFHPAEYRPSAEMPDADYPFILMTGRMLYHYNNGTMTLRAPGLATISGTSYIELNVEDAERLGVADGDRVVVSSRRGRIETTAQVGTRVSPGETWMPFHFADSEVNRLTNAALDEYARIPEYKVCAVQVEAAGAAGDREALPPLGVREPTRSTATPVTP